jgi:multidrug resistance efflux pump
LPKRTAEVEIHLKHAAGFLRIAELALDKAENNVATTLAVNSAIRSKDAICVFWFGSSQHGRDHASAKSELRRVPELGAKLESSFSRILAGKSDAEYAATEVSKTQAADSVRRATNMLELVREQIFLKSS